MDVTSESPRGKDRRIRRDLVVVGASAGGVEALSNFARGLPADLDAAVMVVLHVPPDAVSRLPEILSRAGPLPAVHAVHDAEPTPGTIHVAPPNHHLVLAGGRMQLRDGPRENGFRPAVDALFRSAAASAGPRVIGVILSGMLDDGVAGLAAIAGHGGAAVVQDPADALADAMPRAALAVVEPDAMVPAIGMGEAIVELVEKARPPHLRIVPDASLTADPMSLPAKGVDLGCPECGGALQEIEAGGLPRFRCRVGHVYSPDSLMSAKGSELEAALWAALRALEDATTVAGRIADRSRSMGVPSLADRFERRQAETAERADLVREAIHELSRVIEPDSESSGGVVPEGAEPTGGTAAGVASSS